MHLLRSLLRETREFCEDGLNYLEGKTVEMSFSFSGFVNKRQQLPTRAPSSVSRVALCRAFGVGERSAAPACLPPGSLQPAGEGEREI